MRSVDNDDGGGREHVGGSMTEANDRVNALWGREIEVGKTGILLGEAWTVSELASTSFCVAFGSSSVCHNSTSGDTIRRRQPTQQSALPEPDKVC
jgi:hypothetical protein